MDKVLIILLMEITIEESIKVENLMDLEFIHGQMVAFMKVSLEMDLSTAKANGRNLLI